MYPSPSVHAFLPYNYGEVAGKGQNFINLDSLYMHQNLLRSIPSLSHIRVHLATFFSPITSITNGSEQINFLHLHEAQ